MGLRGIIDIYCALLVFPMLVMLEFSTMMQKILEYVNSLTRGPAKYDDAASKKDESL